MERLKKESLLWCIYSHWKWSSQSNLLALLVTFTSSAACSDRWMSLFVICYPSVNSRMMVYSREPKWKTPVVILVMLWKHLNIWFSLKTADDSSSLSLTLQYPSFLHPPFFLYSNIIWKISLLPKVGKKKNAHLDSSTAAVVIDRDVAVFILKCWTKQIALNLPMSKLGDSGLRESREERSENFMAATSLMAALDDFRGPAESDSKCWCQ